MKHIMMKMKLKKEMEKKLAKISGSSVDWVEEESYFFKLSAWSNKLLKFYKKNKEFILTSFKKK